MSDELVVSSEGKDSLAEIALERFRRGQEFRESHIVHQGKSFDFLMHRADKQYRREYMDCDRQALHDTFGFCPTRYYGLTQIKTNATRAWKRDLTITNLDNIFSVFPTPEPSLDEYSIERIRRGVHQELLAKMADAGIGDPDLLMKADGSVFPEIEDILRDNVANLKNVERARLVSLAMGGAERAQERLRDKLIEGNFRQSYGTFTHNQVLYGMGYMKFPEMRSIPVMQHTGRNGIKKVYETKPMFRAPNPFDMYPVGDGPCLQSNTATIETTSITKVELIRMANIKGYDKNNIEKIITEFNYTARNWLGPDVGSEADYWNPDDTIPLLTHEGFLTGVDLQKAGFTGVSAMEVYNAEIIVCGNRTIKAKLLKSPYGSERSYFAVPFNRFGDSLYDVLGMGAMLWDTEQRVNRIMHIYENNLDWASRPPLMTNPDAFENPTDASNVVPGGQYRVNQEMGVTGQMPEPIRPMTAVSAQYNLIYAQVAQLLRAADEESGIPAFAYGSQDFGRASLGEYSQRMSNALRTIKDAALEEDTWFIEPAFEGMFERLMMADEDLRQGQDVNLQVRGITGLLQKDLEEAKQAEVMGMVVQLADRPEIMPEAAVKFGVRQFLASAGFPVDALGLDDPVIDLALTEAAANPMAVGGSGEAQVPQLDGRSGGVPTGAVADASGATQY